MGPEIWILVGALGVATVLGLGVYVGWWLGDSARELLEFQLAAALAAVAELEGQAKTSHEANAGVLAVERSLDGVSDPVALAKLAGLRGASPDPVAPKASGGATGARGPAAHLQRVDEGA